MRYLVTGATGFIGRHLVERLLARGGTVHALVRESSLDRLEALRQRWGVPSNRVLPAVGDLESPMLGLERETLAALHARVDHFFHIAALYDMTADAHRLESANVLGSFHAVQVAHATEVGRFHHVSSIAAAGRYPGVFREDMFDEATGFDDPYYRTKHAAERVVRSECRVPWRIYRPGIVVGHSETGEMDKVDGPYYFFRPIRRLAATLPPWLPLLGIDGGPLNIVPVDFVARAMDQLAHAEGLDGRSFHLVDPEPRPLAEVLNTFLRAARAPELVAYFAPAEKPRLPPGARRALGAVASRGAALLAPELGIPPRLARLAYQPTRFDASETTRALAGSGIEVPSLESYAQKLWDYWEANLDCDLSHRPALTRAVRGKRVLVSGASAGIGRAAALKLGAAGASVLLVARSPDRLGSAKGAIERAGGTAWAYAADLSSPQACDLLAKRVLDEHGGVDVLVNNAGHSIRRSLELEYERFHDFERTIQLNYFGALKLILAFLPGMRERKHGHIVNVSTLGVQTSGPHFSAYLASKAALDAFARSAASEVRRDGVAITTVYMPLVRTEMSEPTEIFDSLLALTPADAADWICDAIVRRPKRVSNWIGLGGELVHMAAPGALDTGMGLYARLFPDTPAARGKKRRRGERTSAPKPMLGEWLSALGLKRLR